MVEGRVAWPDISVRVYRATDLRLAALLRRLGARAESRRSVSSRSVHAAVSAISMLELFGREQDQRMPKLHPLPRRGKDESDEVMILKRAAAAFCSRHTSRAKSAAKWRARRSLAAPRSTKTLESVLCSRSNVRPRSVSRPKADMSQEDDQTLGPDLPIGPQSVWLSMSDSAQSVSGSRQNCGHNRSGPPWLAISDTILSSS
jgi:hypothetical protein